MILIQVGLFCADVVRYGKGFGLIDYVVDVHHWLNQPNSVYGIIFYLVQISFGEYNCLFM